MKNKDNHAETPEIKLMGTETAPEASEAEAAADEATPMQEAQSQAKENYDKYLRAVAELENYKKRAAREKVEAIKFGNERLIGDFLPVYDALEMAIGQVDLMADNKADKTATGIKQGLELLRSKFMGVLGKHGLEVVESLHKEFDPNFHEALLMRNSSEFPHNTVVAEMEKGFILNGRLLRPARVEVCQGTNKQ